MENQSDINFNEYHFLDSYCNQLSEYDPIKRKFSKKEHKKQITKIDWTEMKP